MRVSCRRCRPSLKQTIRAVRLARAHAFWGFLIVETNDVRPVLGRLSMRRVRGTLVANP